MRLPILKDGVRDKFHRMVRISMRTKASVYRRAVDRVVQHLYCVVSLRTITTTRRTPWDVLVTPKRLFNSKLAWHGLT